MIFSMILSDKNDKPDPEVEKYIHWDEKKGGYRLNKGVTHTERLDQKLEDLGYIYLEWGSAKENYYIYDELHDPRTELHKKYFGDKKT